MRTLLALALLAGCRAEPAGDPADLRFVGVAIPGVDGTTSLAVRDGRIAAVGADADLLEASEEVDLQGAFAMPGTTDSHTHLLAGSFVFDKALMMGAAGMNGIVGLTRSYVRKTTGETGWIVGYGWLAPLTDDANGLRLDEVTEGRPCVLFDSSGHAVLVNSAALALAGIDRDTPDPADGIIERDEDGDPIGVLRESAIQLVAPLVLDAFGDDAIGANFREYATTYFLDGGITSVAEILAVPGVDLGRPQVLSSLEARGEVPIRVNYHMPAFTLDDLDRVDAVRDQHDGDLVRFAGVKIWIDGTSSSGEVWSIDPLVGTEDDHGLHYFDVDQIAAFVRAAEEGAYALKAHANGDGAIDAFLDALELVREERGELRQPYALEHAVLISPPDYGRIAELGVVASVQPTHTITGGASELAEIWADGRFDRTWDFRGLADAGATLALGTDWPVWLSPAALATLSAATGGEGRHHLSIDEAIEAYTVGSATALGRADELGCLDVGCFADLVVYAQDLRTVPSDELLRVGIDHVWIGGQKVR